MLGLDYPGDGQLRPRNQAILLPALDEQGVNLHEGILAFQPPRVEGIEPQIECRAQGVDRQLGETGAAGSRCARPPASSVRPARSKTLAAIPLLR